MTPKADHTAASKGEQTREIIIQQAAMLFNEKGFAGCSMNDLMQATGLKKGGIYNHFANKDELAVAAFEHAIQVIEDEIRKITSRSQDEREIVVNILNFYREYPEDPIVRGGCPLLNTVIDSDDNHPRLKARAKIALDRWIWQLTRLIQRGQENGRFAAEADAAQLAIVMLSGIEGGIALSRLGQPATVMHPVIDHLTAYLRGALNF